MPIIIYVLIVALAATITWWVAQDSRRRGFRELQVLLIVLICLFFFPIGLILYLILRPAIMKRQS